MILVKMGSQKPENRRAARAKTLDFPRNFNDFGENGYPKPEKSARCARQNVDFLRNFNDLVKIGTQNTENRRAARAKTLIFLRVFIGFGEHLYLNPEKPARCAHQNVDYPKEFQRFC